MTYLPLVLKVMGFIDPASNDPTSVEDRYMNFYRKRDMYASVTKVEIR